jgi:hypothetical protein
MKVILPFANDGSTSCATTTRSRGQLPPSIQKSKQKPERIHDDLSELARYGGAFKETHPTEEWEKLLYILMRIAYVNLSYLLKFQSDRNHVLNLVPLLTSSARQSLKITLAYCDKRSSEQQKQEPRGEFLIVVFICQRSLHALVLYSTTNFEHHSVSLSYCFYALSTTSSASKTLTCNYQTQEEQKEAQARD